MKTFRLFISSTFNDMDRERFLLHKRVFPTLKDICARYNARFHPVDLRWGVNEHTQQDFRTMELCLSEVARSQRESKRPNFMILLGDRYGWEPVPTAIECSEYKALSQALSPEERDFLDKAYQEDHNAVPPQMVPRLSLEEWFDKEVQLLTLLRKGVKQAKLTQEQEAKYLYSATHQEIIKGLHLLNDQATVEQTAHVLACIRELPQLDRSQTSLLYDGKDEQVDAIKTLIQHKLDPQQGGGEQSLFVYEADVLDANKGRVVFDEEHFVNAVLAHLEPIIHEELSAIEEEVLHPQHQELRSQAHFRKDRARHFTGRTEELEVIADYIHQSFSEETHRPLAIIAKGGTGKSALMAAAIAQHGSLNAADDDQRVFYRFAGASPRSFKLLTLLETLTSQLNAEILQRYERRVQVEGQVNRPDFVYNFTSESKAFQSFATTVQLLSDWGGATLFIDALDQLKDEPATIGRWLRSIGDLPKQVSLIMSALPTLEGSVNESSHLYHLPALDVTSGQTLLDTWLAEASRNLTLAQKQLILDLYEASGEVLALKLMFMRSLAWKSFSALPTHLPSTSEHLIDLYFTDLERSHNPSLQGQTAQFIERVIGLMISSRWGLTEDELFDIPMSDQAFFDEFQASSHHRLPSQEIPAVMRSRLWFDLHSFLSAQHEQGELLYTFHHRVFNEVAKTRYCDPLGHMTSQWLVDYYSQLPLRIDLEDHKHQPNPRPLIELPFAYFHAGQLEALKSHLIHFDTLMATCEAGLLEMVVDDYENLENSLSHKDQ